MALRSRGDFGANGGFSVVVPFVSGVSFEHFPSHRHLGRSCPEMPRTLRHLYPGGVYHVMARGDGGKESYDSRKPYEISLTPGGESSEATPFSPPSGLAQRLFQASRQKQIPSSQSVGGGD